MKPMRAAPPKPRTALYRRLAGLAAGTALLAGPVLAGPLDSLPLVKAPLLTTVTVDPNVYWALDDSGSMNFEHTTRQHWLSCVYDANSLPSGASCSSSLQTSGDHYTWRDTVRQSTQTTDDYMPTGGGAVLWNQGTNYATAANSLRDANGYEREVYRYDWRSRSSDHNVSYFNPELTYRPWPSTNTTTYANANFRQVRPNGNGGSQLNMSCYNGWWNGTASTANCGTSGNPRGQSPSFTLNHYPAGSGSATGRSTVLNGFVFERWLDTHGFNGDAPERGRAPGHASGGRNTTPNGIVDYWDEHVRYHIRYCPSTNGPAAGRWTASGSGSTMNVTNFPTSVWCPVVGYVVEWFYITYDHAGSGAYTEKVRARGAFAANQIDNAVDPDGNAVGTGISANVLAQRAANWYQYYRTRLQLLKAAVGGAISDTSGLRYAMGWMNAGHERNFPAAAVTDYVASGHNSGVLDHLYGKGATGGTPLTAALEMGANHITNSAPMPYTCQHNFVVLFTDGYANAGDAASSSIGNADGDNWSRSVADAASYYYLRDARDTLADNVVSPRHPKRDADNRVHQFITTFPVAFGLSGYLHDTTGDGWPDRDWNDAPFTPEERTDPPTAKNWVSGSPSAQVDPRRLDIMWKAAWNSDGRYIAASDANALIEGIQATLRYILERTASSSAAAASAGQLGVGLNVFAPFYDSSKWSGTIKAFTFDPDTRTFSETRDFASVLNSQSLASRTILSLRDTNRVGMPFVMPANYRVPAANELSAAQMQALMETVPYTAPFTPVMDAGLTADQIAENQDYGTDLIAWLRGNLGPQIDTDGGVRPFRSRESRMGDIIGSSPAYVGELFRFYPNTIETIEAAASYNTFRNNTKNRTPMIYAGANDGMLHGFEAATGIERLAYVPNAVFRKLSTLASPDYSHEYYVDAPVSVVEAYSPDFPLAASLGRWRSVLVAGLGSGGQGVFALDVTDPSRFSNANASDLVLWEFGDTDSPNAGVDGSPDMGYVHGRVEVGKLANGQWAAIFGNGYNNAEADGSASANGRAKLFIVDIATGRLIREIDTGATGTSYANGLSQPLAVDVNGDFVIDYVYAGDLEGDLWKFDLSSSSTAAWSASRLFNGGPNQPITTRPTLMAHPQGGWLVYFGTGKYLTNGDNNIATYPTQYFLAVWDKPGAAGNVTLANLQQQTVDVVTTTAADGSNSTVRITSNEPVDYSSQRGWYLRLASGERVMVSPEISGGLGDAASFPTVRFISYTPSLDPCTPDGTSWIMQLDAMSGGRPKNITFDFNGDGIFDSLDTDYSNDSADGLSASGYQTSGLAGLGGDLLLGDSGQGNITFSGTATCEDSNSCAFDLGVGEAKRIEAGRLSWRRVRN